MIIIKTNTLSGKHRELSVEEAIQDAATPDPYSYNGQLEKLAGENEKLREIVSRLVECLYGKNNGRFNKAQSVDYILGYGYEVDEE